MVNYIKNRISFMRRSAGLTSLRNLFWSIFSWGFLKTQVEKWWTELKYLTVDNHLVAYEGRNCPNPLILPYNCYSPDMNEEELNSKTKFLYDVIDPNIPTVINLGSYTCPPFRSQLQDYIEMYEKFKNEVNFIVIYIQEAHPAGGWDRVEKPITGICYMQPRSLRARAGITDDMLNHEGIELRNKIPIMIDTMSNESDKLFQAKPERLYVVHEKKVVFRGGRGPIFYDQKEVENFLESYLKDN